MLKLLLYTTLTNTSKTRAWFSFYIGRDLVFIFVTMYVEWIHHNKYVVNTSNRCALPVFVNASRLYCTALILASGMFARRMDTQSFLFFSRIWNSIESKSTHSGDLCELRRSSRSTVSIWSYLLENHTRHQNIRQTLVSGTKRKLCTLQL